MVVLHAGLFWFSLQGSIGGEERASALDTFYRHYMSIPPNTRHSMGHQINTMLLDCTFDKVTCTHK